MIKQTEIEVERTISPQGVKMKYRHYLVKQQEYSVKKEIQNKPHQNLNPNPLNNGQR